eukprot:SAG11_NODE_12607_length_694_cov_3.149580_2_plen_77_part_00
MSRVVAELKEELELELDTFQMVETKRRQLQQEGRRREAVVRKVKGRLDRGKRWVRFLGGRLGEREDPHVRTMRDVG